MARGPNAVVTADSVNSGQGKVFADSVIDEIAKNITGNIWEQLECV